MSFVSDSISEWTLDLNTWNNTKEAEEESPKCSVDLDNRDIYAMVFEAPNPEEVGKEDCLEEYEKV